MIESSEDQKRADAKQGGFAWHLQQVPPLCEGTPLQLDRPPLSHVLDRICSCAPCAHHSTPAGKCWLSAATARPRRLLLRPAVPDRASELT